MSRNNDTHDLSSGLRFSKMHGLGNDFMVVDLLTQDACLPVSTIRQLADRSTGIGFDQLLTVEPPTDPDCDFRYRIYNADGSEVEHCGNGIRCVSRFVLDQGLTHKRELRLQLDNGYATTRLLDNALVSVDMGTPIFEPAQVPFSATARAPSYSLDVDGKMFEFSVLSMGNPHAVLQVDDITSAPVTELGPRIENHPSFPKRVNAGFMQVLDRQHIRLRVFERGAGETRACGTGACAAMVAGRLHGLLDSQVSVELIGGTLNIEWQGDNHPVIMTGPAAHVYEGRVFEGQLTL